MIIALKYNNDKVYSGFMNSFKKQNTPEAHLLFFIFKKYLSLKTLLYFYVVLREGTHKATMATMKETSTHLPS